jgi:hypothetical protein
MASNGNFLDKAKDLALQAKEAAAKNADKIDDAVDKAAEFVDTKTKGKYAKHIDKAQTAAHGAVRKLDDPPARKAGTDPAAPVPDPGVTDRPTPGPTSVSDGPPVASPDPGLGGTAGPPSGDAVPYPPEAPAPPPPPVPPAPPLPDLPGPTDVEYGAPTDVPPVPDPGLTDQPAPGPTSVSDGPPVAKPDPEAPSPG